MHAVYYKKTKNIVLWAYLVTTVQTPTITADMKMTIAFTALSDSRFWSRHVLLSGPTLNCTDTLSTTVTRHKQQTSGRLRTANNTIVKRFLKSCPW